MTTQPEALRLADALDLYATGDAHQRDIEQAAAELRRLHESNTDLLAALKELDEKPGFPSSWLKARAAIAKAERTTP